MAPWMTIFLYKQVVSTFLVNEPECNSIKAMTTNHCRELIGPHSFDRALLARIEQAPERPCPFYPTLCPE